MFLPVGKSDAPCGAMYAFGTLRIHLNFYKVRMNGEGKYNCVAI